MRVKRLVKRQTSGLGCNAGAKKPLLFQLSYFGKKTVQALLPTFTTEAAKGAAKFHKGLGLDESELILMTSLLRPLRRHCTFCGKNPGSGLAHSFYQNAQQESRNLHKGNVLKRKPTSHKFLTFVPNAELRLRISSHGPFFLSKQCLSRIGGSLVPSLPTTPR